MVASISSSTVSDWSNALFSRLDTKNQGFIEKSDIAAAFAQVDASSASGNASAADQLFTQLDSNKDGKVTKSELSSAIAKVADELNAQYDQARVARGGRGGPPPPGADGPPPGGAAEGASAASATSTSPYNAAADTNGDGTVSADEAAAYAKLLASGAASSADTGLTKDQLTEQLKTAGSGDSRRAGALTKLIDNFDKADANGDGKLARDESHAYLESTRPSRAGESDNNPANALAKALQLLKAYVDGEQSASTSQSVSVSA